MIDLSGANREALTTALARCPEHYRPIILAIRDEGCGYALNASKALRPDVAKKADKTKVIGLLKTWIGTGMFVTVEGEDEKRNKRTFVEVGEAATD